jgi:hypothetical protein
VNNIIVVRISLGLPLITILLSTFIDSYSNYTAYAHNFVPNDSATFLTRVYRGEVELSLAKDNFPSNVTLALDHIDNAAEVMNKAFHTDEDIIDDTDFIAKYKKALSDTNSTVHALVLANIVDQVLREYGDAFDIDYDLTNMSNMIMTPATTTSMSDVNSSSLSSISMNTSMHSNMSEISSSKLVNIDDYQSVQRLSEVAYLIFKNELLQQQSLSYSNNTDNDNNNGNNNSNNNIISKLEKRMVDLKNSVNDKVSAQELMALVHTQIHPSLQLAYNLRLIQQQ